MHASLELWQKLETFDTFVYSIKTSPLHEVVACQFELHPSLPPSQGGIFAALYEYNCYLNYLETQETAERSLLMR